MEKELALEIATDAGNYFFNGVRSEDMLVNGKLDTLYRNRYTNNRSIDETIYLLSSETLLDYETCQEEGIEYLAELLEEIEL